MINNETLARSSVASNIFFDERTVKTLFDIISNKPNIKARIQAIKALLSYKSVTQLSGPNMLPLALDTISDCMDYKTHFKGSTTELNYLDIFEDGFLDLWKSISDMLASVQHEPALQAYLNSNSTFLLLQRVTDYLRKELKVPQYSGMFSNEAEFAEDTARLFTESPNNRLETKISKIKSFLEQLYRSIVATEGIKVSFSVFEGIKSLAESSVREYRGLRVLQEIKSSFAAVYTDGDRM